MQIRLLGTGAADGIPSLFAENEVSRFAREQGGKEIRSRAAALIDDVLKIDLPPDTFMQVARDGLRPAEWSAIVFTHTHEDHFAPSELQYVLYPFSEAEYPTFTIFGNDRVCEAIRARYPGWPLELVETESFQSFSHAGYVITPIEAYHKADESCHNLIVQREGKTFLYGTDTGIWEEETMDFLTSYQVDALVIECTEGFHKTEYWGHLSVEECVQVVENLRKQGTLRRDSRIITTHHSALGGARHCDLERELPKFGMEPGYDGMIFNI